MKIAGIRAALGITALLTLGTIALAGCSDAGDSVYRWAISMSGTSRPVSRRPVSSRKGRKARRGEAELLVAVRGHEGPVRVAGFGVARKGPDIRDRGDMVGIAVENATLGVF